jgi:hypothetical protein
MNMPKTRVVIYLDEEHRDGLEWLKGTSISEVGRRAIKEFLVRRNADQNRLYNPSNPPDRKHQPMKLK